ncbi:MAG: hypothetical protein KME64_24675 [Scytonematopsis contorta HA4267-MV1]|nr:hypothetical protein [Scytonematopsis contorta HA4267-MV1]
MLPNLQALITKIASAPNERKLCLQYMDAAGDLFASQHWSIYLQESQGKKLLER